MIDWSARARAKLAQPKVGGAAETDEPGVVSVSAVPIAANGESCDELSSVLSVPADRAPATGRASGNPYMTPDQGDDCHACGWNDAEIATFTARATGFATVRGADAEHLAEQLTLRDRQHDERRLCLECTWLGDTGRCLAAATGRIPGADRRLEPVQTVLHRCGAFGLRKGLI